MLVGDLEALRGQARNAGNPGTRCMVGVEVLLLVSAGYRSYPLPEFEGQEYYIRRFDPKSDLPRDDHQSIISDACKYLSDKQGSHEFWTGPRKQEYMTILN